MGFGGVGSLIFWFRTVYGLRCKGLRIESLGRGLGHGAWGYGVATKPSDRNLRVQGWRARV